MGIYLGMDVFGFSLPRLEMFDCDTVLRRRHVVDLNALTEFHVSVILILPWFRMPLGKVATALLGS